MNWSQLPPVGTPVPLDTDESGAPLGPYQGVSVLTASGTAALALTVKVAIAAQPDISQPEVIIPAYGCPDLVAAVVHAGAKPIITDIAALPYHYPASALQAALSDKTVAIICPTLLGIRLPLADIRAQLPAKCLVIEDNAQWFPDVIMSDIVDSAKKAFDYTDTNLKHADMSIVSFGRGKPVNLLGGGAAFLHNTELQRHFDSIAIGPADKVPVHKFEIKAHGFNALLHPSLYGGLTKLPLGLGETVYHALEDIKAMDETRQQRVRRAIVCYRVLSTYAEDRLRKCFPGNPLLINVKERLLRYPLLFTDKASRDSACKVLADSGLGASTFYNAVLPDIAGLPPETEVRGEIQHATVFAERMLTLPVHPGVSEIHTHAMMRHLSAYSAQLQTQS